MKGNETFTLSANWWKKNKGATVPDCKLTDALKKYEAEHKKLTSSTLSDAAFQDALLALADIKDRVEEVSSKCKKGLHDETKSVLDDAATKKTIASAVAALESKRDAYNAKLREIRTQVAKMVKALKDLDKETLGAHQVYMHYTSAKNSGDPNVKMFHQLLTTKSIKYAGPYTDFKEAYPGLDEDEDWVVKSASKEDTDAIRKAFAQMRTTWKLVQDRNKLISQAVVDGA